MKITRLRPSSAMATVIAFSSIAVINFCFCGVTRAQQGVPACQAPPTMLQLIGNPVVTSAIHRRIQAHKETLLPDGASTLSQEWVDGKRKNWFVENQRGGADLIEAGVVLKDHRMVSEGLHEFEWAFKRQSKETGGWPETGDAFHSVSVFLVDVERSLIVIQENQSDFRDVEPRVQVLLPQVHAAAEWLLRPEVLGPGLNRDRPFTHRRWILAAVLGNAGLLTGDQKLADAAVTFAREGIELQQEDGENPERGGFDVSYQMVDALQGARYYTTLRCSRNAELMAQVRNQLVKTCQWEMRHLLPDGSVNVAGSTRMMKDTERSGAIKHINYKEVIQAFAYSSMITGDPQYDRVAKKMAASQGW